MINKKELEKLEKYLGQGNKTLILTHANPDGDAIGSSIGLYNGFRALKEKVDVACIDGVPEQFQFVKNADKMLTDFDSEDYNAILWVDCGDINMTRFQNEKPEILEKKFKINIDHHPSNNEFGNINFQENKASSASEIVFRLLQALKVDITPDIATCLVLGIYTDTGGFMHQNTKPETLKAASELVKNGANTNHIAKKVFKNYKYRTIKLWSKVLKDLYVTKDGAAIVGIHREDYESLGCTRADLAGVIDYINSLEEARYSVLLSEDEKGNVKASLRTRNDDVDVKALAERFGGGGHVKASGFTIPDGHLEKEVKWKIIKDK